MLSVVLRPSDPMQRELVVPKNGVVAFGGGGGEPGVSWGAAVIPLVSGVCHKSALISPPPPCPRSPNPLNPLWQLAPPARLTPALPPMSIRGGGGGKPCLHQRALARVATCAAPCPPPKAHPASCLS